MENRNRQRQSSRTSVMDSDELLRLLEDNVEDYAIIIMDTEGRILHWNKGAERILGYTYEEAVGKNASLIFTPHDRDTGIVEQERHTAMETGRAVDERYHLRKDGTLFWASGILTALRDERGPLRGFVKILRDMTEYKRLADSLLAERERAEAATREIEKLNARLTRAMTETHHRVKNNLQIMSSLAEVQSDPDKEYVSASALTRIGQHIRSLAAIHDLLTQDAKATAPTGSVSTRALFDKLLPLLQHTNGGLRIRYRADEVRLPAREGASLAFLISEMISNAVKHGQGEIGLVFTVHGDTARLEVSDDGPGFPAGFDPRVAANTGLDLIDATGRYDLRGNISYENRAEGGARVVVTFPIPILA